LEGSNFLFESLYFFVLAGLLVDKGAEPGYFFNQLLKLLRVYPGIVVIIGVI
jgi:hypothetical protein